MINIQVKEILNNILAHNEVSDASGETAYDVADVLLQTMKSEAVIRDDQALAKAIWCCQTILNAQKTYQPAFIEMQAGEFYSGWCLLERAEILLYHMERHYTPDNDDSFGVAFMVRQIPKFQSLFPYTLFGSPGFIKEEVVCSICRQKVFLRSHCGHIVGEIYNGEQCGREVTKCQILEFSLTPNPVQKYSVMFSTNRETGERIEYDYHVVRYVIQGLRSPFDDWDMERRVIRHPHRLFEDLGPDDDCPCETNLPYKDCCRPNPEGVLRPHLKITFHEPPPASLPPIIYPE